MRLRVENKIYSVVQVEEVFNTMTDCYDIIFTFEDFKGSLVLCSVPDRVKDKVMNYMLLDGYATCEDNLDYILKV